MRFSQIETILNGTNEPAKIAVIDLVCGGYTHSYDFKEWTFIFDKAPMVGPANAQKKHREKDISYHIQQCISSGKGMPGLTMDEIKKNIEEKAKSVPGLSWLLGWGSTRIANQP